jgi:MFS family permease
MKDDKKREDAFLSTPTETKINTSDISNIANEEFQDDRLYSIIDSIGYNKYTIIIIILASLLNFIWGMELQYISLTLYKFALHEGVSHTSYSLMSTFINLDICLGMLLIGMASVFFERKIRLWFSSLMYLLGCLLCYFMTDFNCIFYARLIGDFFVGFISIGIVMLAEILPSKLKNFIMNLCVGFYGFGGLLIIILNYYIHSDEYLEDFRLMNLYISVLPLLSLIVLFFYIDSPIYSLSKGRSEEAFKMLIKMGKCHDENFTLSSADREMIIKQYNQTKGDEGDLKSLFSKENFSLTLKSIYINTTYNINFAACFFLLLQTFKEYPQILDLTEDGQYLVFSLVILPCGVIGGIMSEMKNLKLKSTMLICCIITTVCLTLIIFLPHLFTFLISIVFLFSNIQSTVQYIYIAEKYHVKSRDLAQSFIQGLSNFLGCFGPALISLLSGYSLKVSYIFLSVVYGTNLFIIKTLK